MNNQKILAATPDRVKYALGYIMALPGTINVVKSLVEEYDGNGKPKVVKMRKAGAQFIMFAEEIEKRTRKCRLAITKNPYYQTIKVPTIVALEDMKLTEDEEIVEMANQFLHLAKTTVSPMKRLYKSFMDLYSRL